MSFDPFFTTDTQPPWATGFLLAAMSDISYEIDEAARRARFALLGFEERDTLLRRWLAAGDIEVSLLRSGNVAVIAIRGSESVLRPSDLIDWISNGDIRPVPFHGGAFIHAGFARLANLFLPELVGQLTSMRGLDQLWLTGHSMGGAVAQAIGFALHVVHPVRVHRVVTFGAPRIGGALKWAAPAAASGLRADRWVNDDDIGPRVPSTGMFNPFDPRTFRPVIWKHYGTLNFIDWEARAVRFNSDKKLGPLINAREISFSDHEMIEYKYRIFDLMPDPIRQALLSAIDRDIGLESVFARISADLELATPISSLGEAAGLAGTAPGPNLLRTLALRFA